MTFYASNQTATRGGWVLYRDGEVLAYPFPTELAALEYAAEFRKLNEPKPVLPIGAEQLLSNWATEE